MYYCTTIFFRSLHFSQEFRNREAKAISFQPPTVSSFSAAPNPDRAAPQLMRVLSV